MIKLLKLHPAILFLILMIPFILKFVFKGETDVEVLDVISYVIWFSWCGMLTFELKNRLPKRIELSDTLFYISYFFLFMALTIPELITISINPFEDGIFKMFWNLGYTLCLLCAAFQIFNHLSKLLTFIEEEKEIPFSKRFGEFIMFLIFPFGVWFLQPRIIRALEKPEVVYEKYVSARERESMNEAQKNN